MVCIVWKRCSLLIIDMYDFYYVTQLSAVYLCMKNELESLWEAHFASIVPADHTQTPQADSYMRLLSIGILTHKNLVEYYDLMFCMWFILSRKNIHDV